MTRLAWVFPVLLACTATSEPVSAPVQVVPIAPVAPAAAPAPTPQPPAPSAPAATLEPIAGPVAVVPAPEPSRRVRRGRAVTPLVAADPGDLVGANNSACCVAVCDCFGAYDPLRIQRMQEAARNCPGCACPPCLAP